MSDTEDEDSNVDHHHFARKQRRKTRRQNQEGGQEPPIIRGLWVQEIDWLKSADKEMTSSAEIIPPPPQFTDSCGNGGLQSCSCTDVCECVSESRSEDQDRSDTDTSSSDSGGGSDSDCESIRTHESESDSSCGGEDDTQAPDSFGVEARASDLTFDLMHVSGFNSSSHAAWDSDSSGCVQSMLGISDSTYTPNSVNSSQCDFGFGDLSDTDTVVDVLRGRVTRMSRLYASSFFRDLIKQSLNDWKGNIPLNEGLLFHHVRLGSHFKGEVHPKIKVQSLPPTLKESRVKFCSLNHFWGFTAFFNNN